MAAYVALHRKSPRFFAGMLLFVILASLLVGCDSQTTHSFVGQMHVIGLPQRFQIPATIVPGTDGAMWFPAVDYDNFGTTQPSGAIGRVTPAGKITLFPLPANSFPEYITQGPDGKFWFLAIQGEGKVGHGIDTLPGFSTEHAEVGSITPAGKLRLIPLPSSPPRYPTAMTAGPDGNLWFTETPSEGYNNTIARMTPSGKISGEFKLPFATDDAEDITAGPDGNLWFIFYRTHGENAYAKVGRITPQGKITEFALSANIYNAWTIVQGPDGNLWINVSYDIIRITPDGRVKEFPLPTSAGKDQNNEPAAVNLASGPDGALWFLIYPQHSVGRMTTDGTIQQYPYSASTQFPELGFHAFISSAFGSDGTLWFTNGTQLGHFV